MRKLSWDHLKKLYEDRDDKYQAFIAASFPRIITVIDLAFELPTECIHSELFKALENLKNEEIKNGLEEARQE